MTTKIIHEQIYRLMGGYGSGNFGRREQHQAAGRKGGLARRKKAAEGDSENTEDVRQT